ncbi:MAG: hypothetical protein ILO36_01200 [Abditibacteriota bacterium]|nr:hypothetical protein [Abditibacteriota bacterium]
MNKIFMTILIFAAAALTLSLCVGAALNKKAAGPLLNTKVPKTAAGPTQNTPAAEKAARPAVSDGSEVFVLPSLDPKPELRESKRYTVVSDRTQPRASEVSLDNNEDNSDKLTGLPGIMRMANRLPDLRIYTVTEAKCPGLIRNSCNVGNLGGENGSVIIENQKLLEVSDPFSYQYAMDPAATAKKYKFIDSKPFAAGLTLLRYDVKKEAHNIIDERNKHAITAIHFYYFTDHLAVLKTQEGKAVWMSAVSDPLDVRKTDNGYIVLTGGGVSYVYFEDGIPSIDVYRKDNSYWWKRDSKGNHMKVVSGKMLTDNIARIEYSGGFVVHCKIRLTYEDCRSNIDRYKDPAAYVIWHTKTDDKAITKGPMSIDRYILTREFKDTAEEPVYK